MPIVNKKQLTEKEKRKELEEKIREKKFGKSLFQNKNGIYTVKKDGKSLAGRIYFYKITIIRDELDLFEPHYTIKYHDLIYDEVRIIENKSFDEVIRYLQAQKLFIGDTKEIKRIINNVILKGESIIDKETKVFKEGFFIKDGRVIENTPITDIKPTKEDIAEAIELINEIMEDRKSAIANDCTVFRFMLWAPFSWCLKEIGINKGIYALILVGAPKTGKTGSCLNFSWLYSTPSEREKSVSTTSVFGSRLEDSTLPAIIDEAYSLISRADMEDPMKRCIFQKDTRATKDKNNNKITDEFLALGLPIFILNEYYDVKDFTKRRYHINNYTSDMEISDEDMKEFEKEYAPESDNSKLIVLRALGRAFADKFISYLEDKSDKLFDLENLTVNILEEISDEVGVDFIDEIYEIQATSDNYDEDIATKIKDGLNKLFRKNHQMVRWNSHYEYQDFEACADNKEISWLYRRSNDNFVVNKAGFEKQISEIVGKNMTANDIFSELDITPLNEDNNSIRVVGDIDVTRGYEIDKNDLIAKLFDIYIPKKDKSDNKSDNESD